MSAILDVEQAVTERYILAAQDQIAALCCPVTYDPKYLSVIPREIIDRDPRETKGTDYEVTDLSGGACCEPGSDCC
jgi:hypothetical protein